MAADALAGDELSRPEARVGRRVEVTAETGSTNDDLRARAERGEPEGTVLIAEHQTRGRGRLDRRWESPRGKNLLLSALLRPTGLPLERVFRVTMAAGVAAAETLAGEGLHPRIKWPNDVLIGGRKICGILSEMKAEGGRVAYVVLGLGVNLNAEAADFPPELRGLATSVRIETGQPLGRAEFARRLLDALDRWYRALAEGRDRELLEAWHREARLLGQAVEIGQGAERLRGVVRGLDDDGALRLDGEGGGCRVTAGDLRWISDGEGAK